MKHTSAPIAAEPTQESVSVPAPITEAAALLVDSLELSDSDDVSDELSVLEDDGSGSGDGIAFSVLKNMLLICIVRSVLSSEREETKLQKWEILSRMLNTHSILLA